ncbi:MAG: 3-hydroxyacyl-CoA dehydrogenase [Burkholderiales bacterium]
MEKIAIVGAGLVGRAWAIVFARAGYPVTLYDSNPETVAKSLETVEASLQDLQEFGLIGESPSAIRARMTAATSLKEVLDGATYVQESTLENVDIKKQIFADMDAIAAPNTILASSTSTFMTSAFATEVKGRHRCLVAHPVNPPYLIPLVEVSPAPFTAPEVAQRTYDLMGKVGQKPIFMKKEAQGFILNRLQWKLMAEAYRLVDDGYIGVEDLDKCLKDGLGLRWAFIGPFEVGDLNAPGGVADYSRRFGPMIYEMDASEMSKARKWSEELLSQIDKERREQLPLSELGARSKWRDRRLMALMAHKQAMEKQDNK